mmetsp:Transcript_6379/g.17853  ORF Transcript_6379/g.17853 Transcript_6379/m.17853 type:complete len:287 (+) Transcript_6379:161-1021(+)
MPCDTVTNRVVQRGMHILQSRLGRESFESTNGGGCNVMPTVATTRTYAPYMTLENLQNPAATNWRATRLQTQRNQIVPRSKHAGVRLQVEAAPGCVHVGFVHPLKLSVLGIEGSLLEALQAEGEARSQLLQAGLDNGPLLDLRFLAGPCFGHLPLLLLVKDVAMVPEEHEVPLVVKSYSTAPPERWVLAEQRGKHPAHAMPQPGVEVVQNQLRLVRSGPPTVWDVLTQLEVRQPEVRSRAVRKVSHQEAVHLLPVLIDYNHVAEATAVSKLDDLFQLVVAALVVLC